MDFSSVFRTHDFLEDAAFLMDSGRRAAFSRWSALFRRRMDWRRLSLSMAGK